MSRDVCPMCGVGELFQSCYQTFPFRVTFCKCGYDNLDEVVMTSRATLLKQLLDLPEDKRAAVGRYDEMIDGLQDREVEIEMLMRLRGL